MISLWVVVCGLFFGLSVVLTLGCLVMCLIRSLVRPGWGSEVDGLLHGVTMRHGLYESVSRPLVLASLGIPDDRVPVVAAAAAAAAAGGAVVEVVDPISCVFVVVVVVLGYTNTLVQAFDHCDCIIFSFRIHVL